MPASSFATAARCILRSSGWPGEKEVEVAIHGAVEEVVRRGEVRTYDMGGSSTTTEMAEAIAREAARLRAPA